MGVWTAYTDTATDDLLEWIQHPGLLNWLTNSEPPQPGRELCAALDRWQCPHQAKNADAAHNPALLIGVVMFS